MGPLEQIKHSLRSIQEALKDRVPPEHPLVAIVGDPRDRVPYRRYRALVDTDAAAFWNAASEARKAIRRSGEWEMWPDYLRCLARGVWALYCLRVAGYLYRVHVTAVVDVKRHHTDLLSGW